MTRAESDIIPSDGDQGDDTMRAGERRFDVDPSAAGDAHIAFIGKIRSSWTSRGACPKNIRQARESGRPATVEIEDAYREGLTSLRPGDWIHVLTWLHQARRDLAVQAPRHTEAPRGTFSLRSPVRPNPIGLHLVRIVSLDIATGRIEIDAVDVLDGTPLLDIKPYLESVDRPPGGDVERP